MAGLLTSLKSFRRFSSESHWIISPSDIYGVSYVYAENAISEVKELATVYLAARGGDGCVLELLKWIINWEK